MRTSPALETASSIVGPAYPLLPGYVGGAPIYRVRYSHNAWGLIDRGHSHRSALYAPLNQHHDLGLHSAAMHCILFELL